MTLSYALLKNNATRFLQSMRMGSGWEFKFSSENKPNLIASGLAVMLGSLLGWLDAFTEEQKRSWASYLNSFQRADGFFEDEDISDVNRIPGYTKERALLHRTRHSLFALSALGYKSRYEFIFLDDKLSLSGIEKWMAKIDLSNFWDAGNKIMDLAIFLIYQANITGDPKSIKALNRLLELCDANVDPKTGYHDAGKSDLRNAMAGAMHVFPVYFLQGRKPKYPARVIENTLSLQQPDHFFSYNTGSCGEDCLDYDAVNILVNFSFLEPSYKGRIKKALQSLLGSMNTCVNPDGGFCCHRRNENYYFGTITTKVPAGGSSLWSTYSRLLTIAMASRILTDHPVAGDWNLGRNLMEIWDGGIGLMKLTPDFNNLKN